MKTVNSWLFKDPVPTLIDCGENTPESWNALQLKLKENGLDVSDIQKIIITHAHVDHMGMANRIVQESQANVYLSEYAFPWGEHLIDLWKQRSDLIRNIFLELVSKESPIYGFFNNAGSMFDQMLHMWDPIPKERLVAFKSQDGLEFGNRHWEVIYAPGHSSTQTVFFDKQTRQMISADMILNIAPTPVIELDPEQANTRQVGLPKLLESYKVMRALNISKVFPGHYDAFESVNETIDRQLNRIEMRITQCYDFINQGSHYYSDLIVKMYPKRMHFPALVMLIGYLDVLEEREKITKQQDDQGIYSFHINLSSIVIAK